MCATHSDPQIRMREDVPAIDDEVTFEDVPQNMHQLAVWQFKPGTPDSFTRSTIAEREQDCHWERQQAQVSR